MLLLTLITTALAYPYAPYYQPYILGAPLVGGAPAAPATSAGGSAGGKPATRPGMSPFGMGGMGMPFGGIQGFLNMFFPGFASNPGQLFMMDNAMDGDIMEASEKYMQGDFSEAMDKIYDSGDLMPLMAYGRNAMSGLTGRGRGTTAGRAGASGATAGAKPRTGAQSRSQMNPYMWASLIDLKRPRFSPVLSAPRPRTYIQPVVYPNGAVQYFPVNPVNGRLQQMA